MGSLELINFKLSLIIIIISVQFHLEFIRWIEICCVVYCNEFFSCIKFIQKCDFFTYSREFDHINQTDYLLDHISHCLCCLWVDWRYEQNIVLFFVSISFFLIMIICFMFVLLIHYDNFIKLLLSNCMEYEIFTSNFSNDYCFQ